MALRIFGGSKPVAGGLTPDDFIVWQPVEVRFDAPKAALVLRRGESLIDSLDSVEDSKGNTGERGQLRITNLRLIWQSHAKSRVNLSVGFGTLAPGRSGLSIKTTHTRLRGALQSLHVSCSFKGAKFELIFTSLVKVAPRAFVTAQAVHRAFETSSAYRDMKLRGALVRPDDRSVVLLPRERVFTRLDGVWNLASDAGNLGVATITSVRFVWNAVIAENFNVSIPYTAIDTISVRESKFGNTLVIALQGPNGLLFGFRVDPLPRLQELAKELRALREVAFTAPDFGVVHEHEEEEGGNVGATGTASAGAAASAVEEAEGAEGADEEVGGGGDAFAAYLAEGAKEGDRPVTFSHDLGLAIEQLPPGIALQQLWAAL